MENSIDEILDERQQLLLKLHAPLQRMIFYIASPVTLLLYGFAYFSGGTYHDGILFLTALMMCLTWLAAILLDRKISLDTSVYFIGIPLIVLEAVEMLLVKGTEVSCALGLLAVCVYMALYSGRHLLVGVVGSFAAVAVAEFYKYLFEVRIINVWSIKTVDSFERVVSQVLFSALILWLTLLILKKMRGINMQLLQSLGMNNEKQWEIIEAVNQIQPVIKAATSDITTISNNFAVQASEHAASISEVTANIKSIEESVSDSSNSANLAFAISSKMQADAATGLEQLRLVESGFTEVSKTIHVTRNKLNALVSLAENIEEILSYNREIGEHIKVLAVNASIEAAKAGNLGLGFNVVATELRDLIATTDENLNNSSEILTAIRWEATASAKEVNEGANQLNQHFENMSKTAGLMKDIISKFAETTLEVGKIAESAKQQGAGINQVTAVLTELSTAASQLDQGSQDLLISMEQITDIHSELQIALDESQVGVRKENKGIKNS